MSRDARDRIRSGSECTLVPALARIVGVRSLRRREFPGEEGGDLGFPEFGGFFEVGVHGVDGLGGFDLGGDGRFGFRGIWEAVLSASWIRLGG